MKKIYTFTLDSDDYPSRRFRDNIRVIASLVYDYIYNYDGENVTPLNINRNIVYNNISCLYDVSSKYMLDSDFYDDGYINYEPFLIGGNSFGLTIIDDSMGVDELNQIVGYVLSLVKVNYRVRISCFPYDSKDIQDESCRDKVINQINEKFGDSYIKRNKLVRMLKKSIHRRTLKI